MIIDDIHKHYRIKLHTLIADIVDTCERGNLDNHEIISLVLSGLLNETVTAAVFLELTKDEFLQMCSMSYVHIAPGKRKQRDAM